MSDSSVSVNLLDLLSFLVTAMISTAVAFWAVAWNYVNTSDIENVTFSEILATVEEVRIMYAFWLALYITVCVFFTFLIIHEPVLVPHSKKPLHKDLMNLNIAYIFSVSGKLIGLLMVLLFPITNPDLETAHYTAAIVAYGCAILGSALLLVKRNILYKEFKEDKELDLVIFKVHPNVILGLNVVYFIILLGLSLAFVIESNISSFEGKGYAEFVITLFCVVDRIWQLYDFDGDTLNISIIDGEYQPTIEDKKL